MATFFGVPLLFSLIVSSFSLPRVTPLNKSYPAIFNFGDSNSDTGGTTAGFGNPIGAPNGQNLFLKPSGRLCDGRLIIDFFAEAMGLPFLHSYLDSLGAPSFYTGCNFAFGGAPIHPDSDEDDIKDISFPLKVQIDQFIKFKARALQMRKTDEQLGIFLPPEDYFTQGVYTFDIGQNDLEYYLVTNNEDETIDWITTVISEFEAGLERLYTEGARNFWIHNVRPFGCLPRILFIYGKRPGDPDELGCVQSYNFVAGMFNTKLEKFCTKFREKHPDVQLIYNDIERIMKHLIYNYSSLGFQKPVRACCGYGRHDINYDSRISCGQTLYLDGTNVTAGASGNATEYINWDGCHSTEAANKFIFSAILTGNYSYPSLPSEFALSLRSKLNV